MVDDRGRPIGSIHGGQASKFMIHCPRQRGVHGSYPRVTSWRSDCLAHFVGTSACLAAGNTETADLRVSTMVDNTYEPLSLAVGRCTEFSVALLARAQTELSTMVDSLNGEIRCAISVGTVLSWRRAVAHRIQWCRLTPKASSLSSKKRNQSVQIYDSLRPAHDKGPMSCAPMSTGFAAFCPPWWTLETGRVHRVVSCGDARSRLGARDRPNGIINDPSRTSSRERTPG